MSTSIETTSINLGDEGAKGPSIEESFAQLKAEGILADDTDGANVAPPENAQGGADGAGEGVNEDRPSWLPEKFKSVEDMAKAYSELEKKLSRGETEEEPEEGSEDTEADDTAPTEAERKTAEEVVSKAGLDLEDLSAKWFENRALDDADYSALEKQGYPRELVDIFCEGLAGRSLNVINTAYSVAGGADAYEDMITWAAETLSDDEVAAFDAEIASKNASRITRAVKALKADYDRAIADEVSFEPETVIDRGAAPKADVYETQDEYMLDLQNELYDKSEAYRRKVMEKLARSNI